MKREILFRGKRVDDGSWIEGYGVCVIESEKMASIIHRQQINLMHHTEVIPETVGQYTGKTESKNHPMFDDKIKLWEDDVFTIGQDNTKFKVVFENFEWIGISNEGDDYGNFKIRLAAIKEPIHIIGNIHDNPELLK